MVEKLEHALWQAEAGQVGVVPRLVEAIALHIASSQLVGKHMLWYVHISTLCTCNGSIYVAHCLLGELPVYH